MSAARRALSKIGVGGAQKPLAAIALDGRIQNRLQRGVLFLGKPPQEPVAVWANANGQAAGNARETGVSAGV